MILQNILLTVEISRDQKIEVNSQGQLTVLLEADDVPLESKLSDMAKIRDAVVDWYNIVSKRLEEKHAATGIDHQNTP